MEVVPIDFAKYENIRKDLHKIPELKYKEFETRDYILNFLKSLKNFDKAKFKELTETGFILDAWGESSETLKQKRTIIIRTDLDGLPIKEETGVDYTSTHEGVMHACGHDGHMTIVLATTELILDNLNKIPSNFSVRFLFQPAEEAGMGAVEMIKAGCLDDVDEVYGLHNSTSDKLGTIGCRAGSVMSRIDVINFSIKGKGGHGSTPHLCKSPISAGFLLNNSLTNIISQEVSSKETAVLSIGSFHSGKVCNVIPETGDMSGTVRTLNDKVGDFIVERVKEISDSIGKISGTVITPDILKLAGPTVNTPDEAAIIEKIAKKHFNFSSANVPLMASEDFAFYLEKRPGCFFILGSGDQDHKEYLHTEKYNYNDASTPIGVEMFIRIVEDRSGSILL